MAATFGWRLLGLSLPVRPDTGRARVVDGFGCPAFACQVKARGAATHRQASACPLGRRGGSGPPEGGGGGTTAAWLPSAASTAASVASSLAYALGQSPSCLGAVALGAAVAWSCGCCCGLGWGLLLGAWAPPGTGRAASAALGAAARSLAGAPAEEVRDQGAAAPLRLADAYRQDGVRRRR